LHEAASAVTTLRDLADKLITSTSDHAADNAAAHEDDVKMLTEFTRAMDDDLNIAGAIGAVFIWANPLSKQKKIDPRRVFSALAALRKVDHVLGVVFPPLRPLPEDKRLKVEALVADRSAARVAKDWARSDALRGELAALGVEVKDGPTGSTWRPRLAPEKTPA